MRERLNSNPIAQIAVVGVLLVAAGFLVLSSMGGGGEGGESASTTATSSTATTTAGSASAAAAATTPSSGATAGATSAPATLGSTPEVPAPPLPHRVTAAFAANRTVVLLIVKRGGIDDAMTVTASLPVDFVRDVSLFVVPADKIARYAAITQGAKVERVPALVVVRPKRLDHGTPIASVNYGFQTSQSIVQAVIDARYKGRTLSYHP